MSEPHRELEIKFSLSPEQRQRLLERCLNLADADQMPTRQDLRSIYLDTPEHGLQTRGISWRFRHDGAAWLQTIKFDTGVRGGVSSPLEVETPVAEPTPDLDAVSDRNLRKRLAKALGPATLVPVFETNVERRTWLVPGAADARVEVSVDSGAISAGAATLAICEAELELKTGNPQALFEVVGRLFGDDLPSPAGQTKAERGYRLLDGEPEGPPQPMKASLPSIDESSAGEALAALLAPILRQALHNWQVVISSDNPEGPHQLRIAIRRLRTLLKAFAPLLDKAAADEFKTRLRDVARLIGEWRDADVQVVDIVAPLLGHRDWGVDAAPLHDLLILRRNDIRAKVRRELASPNNLRLRLELGLLPALLMQHAAYIENASVVPAMTIANDALRRAWKRVAGRAGHIADLGIEDRHALRKDMKTLRYTVECFTGLYAKRKVAAFTARLSHLQDLFGYVNDVANAQRLMAELLRGTDHDEAARLALGYVIGWHTARAEDSWHRAMGAWHDLHRQKLFWKE